VDLVPAFQGRVRAGPVVKGRVQHGGPAGAGRLHFTQNGFAQVVPHMPAISDLHRVGQGAADGLGTGRRAVTAHDLDARMLPQPCLQGVGGAVGQHIDPLMGLGVDHHGGTAVPPTQGEVVDADHAGHPPGGQRDAQQSAQGRVVRQARREHRQQPCSCPPRQLLDHGLDLPGQTRCASSVSLQHSAHPRRPYPLQPTARDPKTPSAQAR
jgi:hypothetical protein